MIESLYFQCYYAYLLGDLEKAKMYFQFLVEEFRESGKKDSLRQDQLKELKKVKEAIETGVIARSKWLEEPIIVAAPPEDRPGIKQSELVYKIHTEAFDDLRSIISDRNLFLYNIEHPCEPYGNADMMYRDTDTAFPVEVKKHKGKHDLVGQIVKYDLTTRLKLHLNHYQKVQSFTICHSYDEFTLRELKKLDIITLRYRMVNDRVKLTKA